MNAKKYDVYLKDGKALIFPRGDIDECGELPELSPLYETDESGDWWEWCDSRSNHAADSVRVCRLIGRFNSAFANDLLAKAQKLMDRYRAEGAEIGWGELSIDHTWMNYTFRRSAAWKDEPILYTFQQALKWSNKNKNTVYDGEALRARDNLVQLWGMADAVHELGLDIVFDENLKIHLEGVKTMWRTTFE